jgi:uncharacterized membrane protein YphA (DoxX/SURF4 family)
VSDSSPIPRRHRFEWEEEAPPSRFAFKRVKVFGILGAIAAGLGTVMPWIVAYDQSLELTIGRPGIDSGTSGLTVLVFSIVAGIAIGLATRLSALIAAITGFISFLLCVAYLHPSENLVTTLGLPGIAQTGFGLYVSMIGSIVVTLIAAYGLWSLRES